METTEIYAICLGGILAVLLLIVNILPLLKRLTGIIAIRIAKYSTYQFILRRHAWVGPWTVASVLVHGVYLAVNISILCLCYRASSLVGAASGAGRLSLINMIPVFSGTHLSFLADRLGISLGLCRVMHRASGLLCFCLVSFHVAIMVIKGGSFSLSTWRERYTLIGASSLCLLVLLTIPILRRAWYEIFLRSHQALAVSLALGTWQHLLSISTFPWLYTYIFIGVFSGLNFLQLALIIYRNAKWGRPFPRATISHSHGAIRVSVKLSRPMKINAGQYIELWIGSASLASFLHTHPFTVTSWAEIEQDTLELFIQPRRGFTSKLLGGCISKPGISTSRLALLSGPHGVSVPVWNFETVLMVATGYGIAAMLPYLKKLIHGYNLSKGRTRRVHLVWQIPSLELMWAAGDLLNGVLSDDTLGDGYILCMSIFHENGSRVQEFGKHARATVFAGSPNLEAILSSEVDGDVFVPDIENVISSDVNEDGLQKLRKYEREKGRVLVMVSGTALLRDKLRDLVRKYLHKKVQLQELDYQPE